jgi:hypothetical protein
MTTGTCLPYRIQYRISHCIPVDVRYIPIMNILVHTVTFHNSVRKYRYFCSGSVRLYCFQKLNNKKVNFKCVKNIVYSNKKYTTVSWKLPVLVFVEDYNPVFNNFLIRTGISVRHIKSSRSGSEPK